MKESIGEKTLDLSPIVYLVIMTFVFFIAL